MLGAKLPNSLLQLNDVDIAQFTNVSIAMGDQTQPMLKVLQDVDPTFRELPHTGTSCVDDHPTKTEHRSGDMRRTKGSAVLGLLCATAVTGTSGAQVLPISTEAPRSPTTVYLYGATDLEYLRETNFNHYVRAQRILAAANEICRAGPERTYLARFDGADPHCNDFWKTSNPPKKQLSFHLDSVHYIALVSVTASPGKPVKL
jgi:Nucleotidyltransferase